MQRLFIITSLLIAFFATDALAQNAKVVSTYNYIKYYKRDKSDKDALRDGVKAINQAIEHKRTKDKGKTWLYRGQVFFLISADTALRQEYETPSITAYESFRKAIEVGDGFRKEDQAFSFLTRTWRLLYNFGIPYFKKRDFETAYKYFTAAIDCKQFLKKHGKGKKLSAQNARYNAAIAAQNLERYDDAKKHYKELIGRGNAKPGVYRNYSRVLKAEGDTTQALSILDKGREKHPENMSLIIDELNIYLVSDEEEKAIGKLENAVSMDSSNPKLHYALGVAYDEKDKFEKARKAYTKAVTMDTTYYNAFRNLGALYYNKAIELNKEMNNLDLDAKEKYEKLKKERNELYADALPYLQKAKKLKPDDLRTLKALKEIYAKMGKYDKSDKIKQQIMKVQGKG